MEGGAEVPEALAAGELAPPLGPPTLGIAPEPDRLAFAGQLHAAAGIELGRRRQVQAEMVEQAAMDAAALQACHLGGAHIKGVGAAAEGAGAAAALAVGLQQHHL